MTPIEALLQLGKLQLDEVTRLRNLGYQKRGVTHFQKSIMKRAFDAVDSTNREIEKIEYRQSEVVKVLKEAGLSTSKKQCTAIRGYNTYTKGYEIDNKYSVSHISLHSVSQNEVDLIHKLAEKTQLNISVTTQGITLNK